jgi:stage II sporulation protein E
MKFQNVKNKSILKYLTLCFVCLILSQAQISGLSPFLFAFYFACLYVGVDEKLISIFTLGFGFFASCCLENFLVCVTVVAVGLIVVFVHKFAKRKIHLFTIFASFVISCVTYIYYNFFHLKHLVFFVLLGMICVFVYIVVLQVLFLRKNCFKLTLDESVCFLFAIASFGVGLSTIQFFNFSMARFFLCLIILICVSTGSPTLTYSIVLSFSLGCSLPMFDLTLVAEFVLLAMLANMFGMPNKFKIIFILLIGDCLIQYCFVSQSFDLLFNLLPLIVASVIFVLLPNRFLVSLSDLVYVKKSEITSRNAINTTRKNIKKRMVELSNVFKDMQQIHLNMTKKELTKDELIDMLTREVMSTCCKDCLDKNRCTRSLGTDNKSNLQLMIEIAVTKGKITLLDVPAVLSNRCAKVNNLIGLINRICDEYKQYKNMMADVNNVKVLMADQMGAVSRLLLDVGEEIDTNVRFDVVRENKIISRLLSQNIQCKEVLLYTEKNEDVSAILVVKAEQSYNPIIEKVLTETLKMPMQIAKISPLEESDFNSVQLRVKNKYDCVFGLASCTKAGNVESGDCHSIIRLGRNKFLLALCDGMGAGSSAHKMSAMTLGLIENFYKVGFDNEIILESVNKLLAINNQETYSTLDICLFDLDKKIADFIKVGAPYGIIKRESNIELVEGSCLPIGVLENIAPATHKTTISTKDIVIMATDGVVDAFENYDAFVEFVGGIATNNPQTIAESILNEALALNSMSAKDDMTVLVARIYLKT